MVNVNLGRLASYLPAEKIFDTLDRTDTDKAVDHGWHLHRLVVPLSIIRESREHRHETNPAQLSVNLAPDEVVMVGAGDSSKPVKRKPRL